MAVASAIWYGAIAWIGFRFGQNLEQLETMIGTATRASGLIAVAIVVLAAAVIFWRRRRGATP
jgi:membrane protein DedA with SNARE-associated domain